MKFLIYQYYRDASVENKKKARSNLYLDVGHPYQMMSKQSIEKYAKKYNIDYKFFDHELPDNLPPFYSIFLPFTEGWCDDYDAVCFIDSDILATKKAKNLFEYSAADMLSAMKMQSAARWRGNKNATFFQQIGGHLNSGVVVFPRAIYADIIKFTSTLKERDANRTPMENNLGGFDQGMVNTFVSEQGCFHDLEYEFNFHMGRHEKNLEDRFNISLIHYHREYKKWMDKDWENESILK